MVRKKEVIFLKDSTHGLTAGLGAGPNTRSLESLLWVLVCRCSTAHHPSEGRLGLPSHKNSTRNRAGCHLCDSILGQAACSW